MTDIEHTIHELLAYADKKEVKPYHVEMAKGMYLYFREFENKENAYEIATLYLDRMQELLQK